VKGAEGIAPHAGLRRGRPAIVELFKLVDQNIAFATFEPHDFLAQGALSLLSGVTQGK
jgi:hypothetical protein